MSEPPPGEATPPGWAADQPPAYGAPPPAAPGPAPATWSGSPGWGTPPGWAAVPAAPRPGVVPLRPLSVMEILDGSITTMRRYPKPMLGLSFVVTAALAVVGFGLSLLSLGSLNGLNDLDPQAASPADVFGAMAPMLVGALATAAVQTVALILLTGVLTVVVGQAVLGAEMTIGQAWAALRPRAWRLIGLSLLLALIVGAGFVACVFPGIIVGVFLALATPALILEKSRVTRAMGRSWALVTGAWWRTFGIVLLVLIIYGVITTAVSVPFSLAAFLISPVDATGSINSGWYVVTQALSAVGSVAAGTIGYPFVAAAIALVYIDRRMRREGLDLVLARAAGAAQD